ncbi:DNA ligase D [Acidovorax sp. sic0104]|uniref:DNA ligase D n=1 Tax=Acidovorax sp. sic0104 TaxID=2854784 RepID=UPI002101FE8C|nr:DNA ligase D [Acidovorax sp. sic0104]
MKDSLAQYKKKRNFTLTPEPADGGMPGAQALQYVIQKHWASRLHYDLRLEIDGTMKSWAVPKGPSYDPADKRMAVQVEDHPISYNTFEGQIPPRQYGAGRVIIWDRGYWVPVGDPADGYRKGKLKFSLHGHKLQGHWTLVRMHGRSDDRQPPWLLIKERDGLERPASEFSVVDELPDSVAAAPPVAPPSKPAPVRAGGGRTKTPTPPPTKAPRAPLPAQLSPQLATLVDRPPADTEDWIWELKFDGYRLLARVERGKARLYTRNGHDWTDRMPVLASAIAGLPIRSGWLDGEVMVQDAHGIPDFQALQNAFDGQSTESLVFYVFDLPFADGHDLRGLPLLERRERLRQILQGGGDTSRVRFSEAFEAAPGDLVSSACKLGFEGVIGKLKRGTYSPRRSAEWIKLKCSHRQEFVIGGYTDPQGSRTGIGSLLLGVHDDAGALRYAGNVGTGFSERVLGELHAKLRALAIHQNPFADPRSLGKNVHWVGPILLAEVSFAGWTKEGKVRHAVFHGLRTDKPPQAIVQEKPESLEATRADKKKRTATPVAGALRVSHPDRVIDPSTGLTKIGLIRYYATVAPLLMEHLKGRPVSLVRAPDGVDGPHFFQKHLDTGTMPGVRALPQALDPGHPPLLEVASADGLLSAAQMNAVEFHTWNARKDMIARPDRITFDLDPGEGVPWEHMQEAATLVRAMLTELGLPAFLKTSGGKGLHVVVPIKRLHDWGTVKAFSQAVVQHLADTIGQRFVAKSGPKNRVGKIFVDYLRNGFGATTASAWTARARSGMGVSVPVAWDELDELASGAHWSVQNIGPRLPVGNGPWQGYGGAAVSISAAMKTLD